MLVMLKMITMSVFVSAVNAASANVRFTTLAPQASEIAAIFSSAAFLMPSTAFAWYLWIYVLHLKLEYCVFILHCTICHILFQSEVMVDPVRTSFQVTCACVANN
jgi:hypothetical protein